MAGRSGVQRLVAEVSLAHVGIILGLEMSRLARSNRDGHHLLEVCALFGTLIGDLDGIYPYSATSQGTLKLPSVQRHCAIADPVPSSCHQREFDALGWDHGGLLLTIRMLDIPYTR